MDAPPGAAESVSVSPQQSQEASKQNSHASSTNSSMCSRCDDMTAEIDTLQQTLQDVLAKMQELEHKNNSGSNRAMVRTRDAETQDDADEDQDASDARELLVMVKASLSAQQDTTEQLRNQNAKLVSQLEKKQSKFKSMESELIKAREEAARLMEELAGARCEARGLRDEVDLLKRADVERKIAHDGVNDSVHEDSDMDDFRHEMEDAASLRSLDCEALEAVAERGDPEELEMNLREFLEKIRKYQAATRLRQARSGRAGGSEDAEQLRRRANAAEQTSADLKEELEALLARFEAASNENGGNSLKQTGTNNSRSAETLQNGSALKEELQEANVTISQLQDEIDTLHDQLEQAASGRGSRHEVNGLKRQLQESQDAVSQLRHELQQAQDLLSESQSSSELHAGRVKQRGDSRSTEDEHKMESISAMVALLCQEIGFVYREVEEIFQDLDGAAEVWAHTVKKMVQGADGNGTAEVAYQELSAELARVKEEFEEARRWALFTCFHVL
jgi:chromosome segregation ATPase